jgi:hypothetical protein
MQGVDLGYVSQGAREAVVVKDRVYRLRSYERCFVASELVDWLVSSGTSPSRAAAVTLGRELSRLGLVRHVVDESKVFDDAFLFYRWREDFEARNVSVFRLQRRGKSRPSVNSPGPTSSLRRSSLNRSSEMSDTETIAGDSPRSEAEKARLRVLRALKVLDTEHEAAFQRLAEFAAELCGCPIATVSFVDENRVWLKAEVGLRGLRETAREGSFCDAAIRSTEVFVVEDARANARFAKNKYVTGPQGVQFFAGAPLIAGPDGQCVGVLAVMDTAPRRSGLGKMVRSLTGLALQVLTELELRRALAEMNVQRRNVDDLLCNVLPGSVAVRLLKEPRVVDEVPACTCAFMDLVGFTAFTEANSAQAVVQNLDALFTLFDSQVLKHGVCKV